MLIERARDEIRIARAALAAGEHDTAKAHIDQGVRLLEIATGSLGIGAAIAVTSSPRRPPTGIELFEEAESTLQALAAGDLGATDETRHLAQAELDARAARRERGDR